MVELGPAVLLLGCALALQGTGADSKKRFDALLAEAWELRLVENQLEIRELRARAERALGERFDVRAFHDAVLENGSVPLTVLEERIDSFIALGR